MGHRADLPGDRSAIDVNVEHGEENRDPHPLASTLNGNDPPVRRRHERVRIGRNVALRVAEEARADEPGAGKQPGHQPPARPRRERGGHHGNDDEGNALAGQGNPHGRPQKQEQAKPPERASEQRLRPAGPSSWEG